MALVLSLEDSAGCDTNIEVHPNEDFQTFLLKAKSILGYEVDLSCITKDKEVALTDNIYEFLMTVETDEEDGGSDEEPGKAEEETTNTEENTLNNEADTKVEQNITREKTNTENALDNSEEEVHYETTRTLNLIDETDNTDDEATEIEVLDDIEETEDTGIALSQQENTQEIDPSEEEEDYMQVEYLEEVEEELQEVIEEVEQETVEEAEQEVIEQIKQEMVEQEVVEEDMIKHQVSKSVQKKVTFLENVNQYDDETEDLEVLDSDIEIEIYRAIGDMHGKAPKEEPENWDNLSEPDNNVPDRTYTRNELLDILGGSPEREPPAKRKREDSKTLMQAVFFGTTAKNSSKNSHRIEQLMKTVRQPIIKIERMSHEQVRACIASPEELKKYTKNSLEKPSQILKSTVDDDLSRYIPSQYEDIDNEGIYDVLGDSEGSSLLKKVDERALHSVNSAVDEVFGPVKKGRGRPRKYPLSSQPNKPVQPRVSQPIKAEEQLAIAQELEDDITRLEGLIKREGIDPDDEDYVPGKELTWGRYKAKPKASSAHTFPTAVCRMCRGTVPQSEEAITHAISHKLPGRNVYPCIMCPYGFTTPEEVREHMVKEHALDQPPKKQGRRGRKPKNYQPPLLVPKLEPTPQDPEDELVMEDVVMLEEWLDDEQNEFIQEALLRPKLEPKLEPVDSSDVSECEEEWLLDDDELSAVLKMELPLLPLPGQAGVYHCRACSRDFDDENRLMHHKCTGGMRGSFRCALCGQCFTTRPRLTFHRTFHQAELLGRSLRCNDCPTVEFGSEAELYDHINIQHNNNFFCTESGCGREFQLRSSLRAHGRIHGKKRHRCEECGKVFFDIQNLKEHRITHLNVKPFQCHICLKFVNRRSRLRMHLLAHESRLPNRGAILACRHCSMAFRDAKDAQAHLENSKECCKAIEDLLDDEDDLESQDSNLSNENENDETNAIDESDLINNTSENDVTDVINENDVTEEPSKEDSDDLEELLKLSVNKRHSNESKLDSLDTSENIEDPMKDGDDVNDSSQLIDIEKVLNEIVGEDEVPESTTQNEDTEQITEAMITDDIAGLVEEKATQNVTDENTTAQENVNDQEIDLNTIEGSEHPAPHQDNLEKILEDGSKEAGEMLMEIGGLEVPEMPALSLDEVEKPRQMFVKEENIENQQDQNLESTQEFPIVSENSETALLEADKTNENGELEKLQELNNSNKIQLYLEETGNLRIFSEEAQDLQEYSENAEKLQNRITLVEESQEFPREVEESKLHLEVVMNTSQEYLEESAEPEQVKEEFSNANQLVEEVQEEVSDMLEDLIEEVIETKPPVKLEPKPELLLKPLPRSMRRLLKAVTVSMVYRCEYCEKVFWQKESLNLHRVVHRGVKTPFICNVCFAPFSTYARCTSHKTSHGFYKANPDSDLTERSAQQVTACEAFPVVKHFLCEVCDKTFLHWTYLQVHRRHKHSDTAFMFCCRYCDEKFAESWMLNHHRKKMHGDQVNQQPKSANTSYKCAECGEGFNMRKDLGRHMDIQHGDNSMLQPKKPPGPFKCSECSKEYRTKVGLDGHMRIHNGGVYLCALCGNGFAHRAGLDTHHKRVHLREQRHSCTVCGQAFFSIAELDGHSRCHTGEKPFPCNFCPMYFRTKGRRNEHHRIHTGERPYPCDICGLAFRRSHAMKNHRLIHTGVRQHRCPHCLKLFHVRSNLNTHIKTKHPGQFLVVEVQGGAEVRAALEESLKQLASSDRCQLSVEEDPDNPDAQYEFQQEELEYSQDEAPMESAKFAKLDEENEGIQYVEDNEQLEDIAYIQQETPAEHKDTEELAVQYAVEGEAHVQYLVEQVSQEDGGVQYAIKYIQPTTNSTN